MPARRDIESILVIGSGPIVIGQACEFDYSGNQAVTVLKEEGYRVILVNPNPATVMTTPGTADAIYMEPLEVEYLEEIIRTERPDAVLATMGGQTALNLAMDLDAAGVFRTYGVEIIGAGIDSIRLAEDRGEFKKLMDSIGLESPRSALVGSLEEGEQMMGHFGLPLIIRPSYTLGGKGGSIAATVEEARKAIGRALAESPVHTALVEESLLGWKEFELEVMRDAADNAVIVCSIENIDPMGVHTGDSITIAPVQTLSDREYQRMRTAAIDILRAVGVDCGGSNVQFGLNPVDGRMVVIEMNPRVSRSSALASKATGFPIARASARLAVGCTLDEVMNEITGKTVSCFEPTLDYTAVKVPRFELEKFPSGYASLGTQMKSVGESLALGRTALEALNKAIRAAEYGFQGLQELPGYSPEELRAMVSTLHPRRIFAIYSLIRRAVAEGEDLGELLAWIYAESGFDHWFLALFQELALLEQEMQDAAMPLERDLLLRALQAGLTDERIATICGVSSGDICRRREELDLRSVYHLVDTCAGEFEAETPYFYSTWGEEDEGEPVGPGGVLVIGSGPNRIGQGLEFDTCCTLSSLAFRGLGRKTVMVNSNPETVSTDYNVSDRLYLEPLTAGDIQGILRKEGIRRVVVQLGGQTPLNMARALEEWGAEIVGTSLDGIDTAEDRARFADLLNRLGLQQPRNSMAGTPGEVCREAERIGYPVLLRPSFVLGGRSMMIAYTEEELKRYLEGPVELSPERPILVDQFLEDAFEYDLDAVSDGQNVYVGGIMQHIEAAGVHSGDSACVFPPFHSDPAMEEAMVDAAAAIARALNVQGFLNIQFAVQRGELYLLEVNPRASRTVPYLSKSSGVNLVEAVVRLWEGENLVDQGLVPSAFDRAVPGSGVARGRCIVGWAVKEAMFSFDRFMDHDPLLGPEMRSTGETIGMGASFGEAFAKASAAAGTPLPKKGRVFVSVHDSDKEALVPVVRRLQENGFSLAATRGTAAFLFEQGILAEVVLKVHEGHPHILDHLESGRIDLVINTPLGRFSQADDGYLRIAALQQRIPYTTTISAAQAAVEAIQYLRKGSVQVQPLPEGSAPRKGR
ncbi:carbamoyl phosphate synthase large subunit [Alkalispirochaeta sphaeroplastigenens]|uniref:Carbamoyl phosphate synthase large subunit n=1 Tax=Alkalispirochaeta sphaeroplastigenens TaxID=1187066 RepID=A0A2S4K1L6_9SPIO|nr:carbamoyl-phosphate synthase large subunit [Alkalispirochaeta sphaeroplastigenens]POR05656.1 carbamoyl phosphate synthase large subunit [Alkalispirochaeta sphaeroplastigenens]